jgi:hypothetical protein
LLAVDLIADTKDKMKEKEEKNRDKRAKNFERQQALR